MRLQQMIPTAKLDQQNINQVIMHLNHYKKSTAAKLQNTNATLRETYNFGYDYFAMTRGDYSSTEIPNFLTDLCQHCIGSFGNPNHLGNYQEYNNVIVSMYYEGYCLEPHVDVDINDQITDGQKVDFYFGENVLGVVLVADSEGKFYISEDSSENYPNKSIFSYLDEEEGTVFLLQGKYRRYPYLHGVSKVKNKRISVTFRTVYFNK
jgi:hypothetical protein